MNGKRSGSVSIELSYGLDDLDFITGRVNNGAFLYATLVRPVLGPTQPPIQCVPGHEDYRSPSSSAEVKNAWSVTPLSQYVFMAW
jgi:hypothetical protein